MTHASERSGFMTTGEVAEEFGVDPKTVARWARDGKLPYLVTPGGHRRFSRAVIADYIVSSHVIRVGDEEVNHVL